MTYYRDGFLVQGDTRERVCG